MASTIPTASQPIIFGVSNTFPFAAFCLILKSTGFTDIAQTLTNRSYPVGVGFTVSKTMKLFFSVMGSDCLNPIAFIVFYLVNGLVYDKIPFRKIFLNF